MKRIWPFLLWLGVFYAGWLTLVIAGGHWDTVLGHWPIALAMALGSYVAGSTPMGGGSVGFPVLVLLFDMPGSLGRNFGLAVQSVGMVSASIFILSTRRPLEWKLLRPAMLGALIGTPLGAAVIAPFVPDIWVKLTFAVIWASFGVMHLLRMRELVGATGISASRASLDRPIALAVGLTGGVAASITGVGIDMVLYAALVLLYRADLKIAIPSSVVIMAFTSVVGLAANVALGQVNPARYAVDPAVFANWLAAAPIVVLGAPFGALMVNLLPRTPTLMVVSFLCVGQFVWTLVNESVWGWTLVGAGGGLLLMHVLFHVMYSVGRRGGEAVAGGEAAVMDPGALLAAEVVEAD